MPAPIPFVAPSFSVVSASQTPAGRVRITFSAPPMRVSPSGPSDALNISNYSLTGGITPSAAVVVPEDPNSVDLIFTQQLLGSYSVAVNNIVAG